MDSSCVSGRTDGRLSSPRVGPHSAAAPVLCHPGPRYRAVPRLAISRRRTARGDHRRGSRSVAAVRPEAWLESVAQLNLDLAAAAWVGSRVSVSAVGAPDSLLAPWPDPAAPDSVTRRVRWAHRAQVVT